MSLFFRKLMRQSLQRRLATLDRQPSSRRSRRIQRPTGPPPPLPTTAGRPTRPAPKPPLPPRGTVTKPPLPPKPAAVLFTRQQQHSVELKSGTVESWENLLSDGDGDQDGCAGEAAVVVLDTSQGSDLDVTSEHRCSSRLMQRLADGWNFVTESAEYRDPQVQFTS